MAKRIFVCSPLRGDYEANIAKARAFCKQVLLEGCIPYAPHLFFTQFLDDTDEAQRMLGIEAGIEELRRCDELWAFLAPGAEPSQGMKMEIAVAQEVGIPVRFREA